MQCHQEIPEMTIIYSGKSQIDDEHETASHKKKLKEELEHPQLSQIQNYLGIPYKLMFYNMCGTVKIKRA